MRAKVLKTVPGSDYAIGDEADFDELAAQWLVAGEYIEEIKKPKQGKSVDADNTVKPKSK